jgi:hypothetical protein
MLNGGTRRIIRQIIIVPPVVGWPYRSWRKATTTNWADIRQKMIDARGAKGAFKTTNAGVG